MHREYRDVALHRDWPCAHHFRAVTVLSHLQPQLSALTAQLSFSRCHLSPLSSETQQKTSPTSHPESARHSQPDRQASVTLRQDRALRRQQKQLGFENPRIFRIGKSAKSGSLPGFFEYPPPSTGQKPAHPPPTSVVQLPHPLASASSPIGCRHPAKNPGAQKRTLNSRTGIR